MAEEVSIYKRLSQAALYPPCSQELAILRRGPQRAASLPYSQINWSKEYLTGVVSQILSARRLNFLLDRIAGEGHKMVSPRFLTPALCPQ